MPTDTFASFTPSLNDPARGGFAISPSDTTALAVLPRALFVGTGGTLVVRPIDGATDLTFRNLVAGQVLALRVSHVRATGTTATDLIGLV